MDYLGGALDSVALLGDFNAHMGWVDRNGLPELNPCGVFLLNSIVIGCKSPGVGGVQGGYGKGLLVGLGECLANHQTTQERKAGLGPGCAQPGRRTADSGWVYHVSKTRDLCQWN